MIYYKVKPEYDQKRKDPLSRNCDFLVAHELYTKSERNKMIKVPDGAFERIEVPKTQTYWFFGARFAKCDSPFTRMPIIKEGI